jgi:hypothetical protein
VVKKKYKRRPKCHPHCRRGRHVFTKAECVKGYEAAIVSIITRFPDAVGPDGSHMACKFLRAKNPLWFEVRKLKGQVASLVKKHGAHDERIRNIERALTKLTETTHGKDNGAVQL